MHDIASSDFLPDSIAFADSARRRLAAHLDRAQRPLVVAIQGDAALPISLLLAGVPASEAELLMQRIGTACLAVRLVAADRSYCRLQAPEGSTELLGSRPLRIARGSGRQAVVGATDLPPGLDLVALPAEDEVGCWAQLTLADTMILAARRHLGPEQLLFLLASRPLPAPLFVFLSEAQPHAVQTTRSCLADLGVSGEILTAPGELQQRVGTAFDRACGRCTEDLVSAIEVEAERLRGLQSGEIEFLRAPADSQLADMAELATGGRSAFEGGRQLLETALERIDRAATLELDQLLQSGGPIAGVIEEMLSGMSALSFNGWHKIVDRLNQALPVLGGLGLARIVRKAVSRTETSVRDAFPSLGPSPSLAVDLDLSSLFQPLPLIEPVATWNSLLSGGIKGFLSERMTSLLTKFVPGPLGMLIDRGTAMITAVDNVKKVVKDELRSQTTLTAMPALGSLVGPIVRDAQQQLRAAVAAEALPYFESCAEDALASHGRCASFFARSPGADRDEEAGAGIDLLARSLKALEHVTAGMEGAAA